MGAAWKVARGQRGGIAVNVFSMFSSTASVDLTPACR